MSEISSRQYTRQLADKAELILFFIRRSYIHVDVWYVATILILSFMFAYLFKGYGHFEISGLIIYNAVWFGVLAGMSVHDDRDRGLIIHLRMAHKNMTLSYFIANVFGATLLSSVTSVALSIVFLPSLLLHLPIVLVLTLITVTFAFIISAAIALRVRRTSVAFGSINSLFVFLAYLGNTIIPVSTPFNPIYYLTEALRLSL